MIVFFTSLILGKLNKKATIIKGLKSEKINNGIYIPKLEYFIKWEKIITNWRKKIENTSNKYLILRFFFINVIAAQAIIIKS